MDRVAQYEKDIPCFEQPRGCILSDHDSRELCEDRCVLLKMWSLGYDAGVDACPPTSGPGVKHE